MTRLLRRRSTQSEVAGVVVGDRQGLCSVRALIKVSALFCQDLDWSEKAGPARYYLLLSTFCAGSDSLPLTTRNPSAHQSPTCS